MSSKRALRRKKCTGKIPHETIEAARLAAAKLLSRKPCGEHLSPYRCGFCSKFHVGHTPGRNAPGCRR